MSRPLYAVSGKFVASCLFMFVPISVFNFNNGAAVTVMVCFCETIFRRTLICAFCCNWIATHLCTKVAYSALL